MFNPKLSADGSKVVFEQFDASSNADIILYDVASGAVTNITASANGTSQNATISADGSTIAFESTATNLVPGDTVTDDVFLYDIASGEFANLTLGGNAGSARPKLSADGSTVVFDSEASNLTPGDLNHVTDVFLYG